MSTISGPYTISPTVPANLQQPLSGGTLGQCVLDNLSGYLLQVNVGPNVFYQAPLVESMYDLTQVSGAPILVSAILLPGDLETSGVVAPTWFDVGELPDATQWPIALSGPAEVAAATAAALLTSGIPSVLTTKTITPAGGVNLQGGQFYQGFLIGGFASIIVFDSNSGSPSSNYGLKIAQGIDNSGALNSPESLEYLTGPADIVSGWNAAIQLPVVAPFLYIQNLSPDGAANVANITVVGTNRALSRPYYNSSQQVTVGQQWIGGPAALALGANNFYPGFVTFQNQLTGPARVTLHIDDTTSAFTLFARYANAQGAHIDMPILDTSQLTNFGTHRQGSVDVVLPAPHYYLTAFVDVASAGNVNITVGIEQNV